MFKHSVLMSVLMYSTLSFSLNATSTVSTPIPPDEPKLFEPRKENVKLILSENESNQPTILIFTNVAKVVLKSASLASTKIYSLLNWKTEVSEKTETAEAYKRKMHFGGWVRNPKEKSCYNTRAKVLMRDSLKPVTFKENNCTVAGGEWQDPYSEELSTDAQLMQIDHMVPLKVAYVSGAYKWNYKMRCLYGNYMGYKEHLISAYGEENNMKGDQTPESYMPPKETYKCQYLKDWLFVKALWGLTMDPSEATAIKDLVSKLNCDPSAMKISSEQIKEQSLFVNQNKDLCAQEYKD